MPNPNLAKGGFSSSVIKAEKSSRPAQSAIAASPKQLPVDSCASIGNLGGFVKTEKSTDPAQASVTTPAPSGSTDTDESMIPSSGDEGVETSSIRAGQPAVHHNPRLPTASLHAPMPAKDLPHSPHLPCGLKAANLETPAIGSERKLQPSTPRAADAKKNLAFGGSGKRARSGSSSVGHVHAPPGKVARLSADETDVIDLT